jgi:hypothetical protein
VEGGLAPNSFLQLPCHIAQLVSRGLWQYITMCPSMKFDVTCSLKGLRFELQRVWRDGPPTNFDLQEQTAENLVTHGVGGGMFRWIADSVAGWSSDILQAAVNAESREERRLQLEQMVTWLREVDRSSNESELINSRLQIGEFGNWNHRLQKFASYKAGFLLECLVLTFALRSASDLKSTLVHAVQVLPPVWRSSLLSLMRDDASLPSAATLTRARLLVDVAFMLMQQRIFRDLLQTRPVLYGLVDSSPQGGRNWELFEIYGMPIANT